MFMLLVQSIKSPPNILFADLFICDHPSGPNGYKPTGAFDAINRIVTSMCPTPVFIYSVKVANVPFHLTKFDGIDEMGHLPQ